MELILFVFIITDFVGFSKNIMVTLAMIENN